VYNGLSEKEALEILNRTKAVIKGSHVVYTSGMHGSTYVNKDAVYPHTVETARLCRGIAGHFADDGVEVVIAPAVGGIILSQWTAYHFTTITGREVLGVYAEKEKHYDADPGAVVEWEGFAIRRGYDKLIDHKHVLVVEDVLTTGGSVKKVIAAVRACGGTIAGVGALCNRGGITAADLGVRKLFALVNVTLDAYPEATCPLCAEKVPINTDVGKGREFLARQKQK